MTKKELKWHRRFLELCDVISKWSKDRSTKTGCVIVKNNRIISTGYNGFPPGVDDEIEERHGRPQKYMFTEHCDRNAIYQAAKLGVSLENSIMYLNNPPCHDCCRGIIMSGIRKVIWPEDNPMENNKDVNKRWQESLEVAFTLMKESGVKFYRIPKEK